MYSAPNITPTGQRGKEFTFKDLTIGSYSGRAKYKRRQDDQKKSIHWGQRKLHLSEVEFFTLYWDPLEVPNPICVYAGSAPGTHIALLSKMFPDITFHLYDTNRFDISESDKIKIFKQYFTDEDARKYAGRDDIYLVSDIRVDNYDDLKKDSLAKRGITTFDSKGEPVGNISLIKEAIKESEKVNEDSIWRDMQLQQNWVLIINPVHALLKFRLPYILEGKDIPVEYLKGVVYWQPWAPQTSTETRLKPIKNAEGKYELSKWSSLEYEEWCFYHNTVSREQTYYYNIFDDKELPIDGPELLNDYDSVAEAFILKLYVEKFGNNQDIYDSVKKISKLTTWSINRNKPVDKAKDLNERRTGKPSYTDPFRKKEAPAIIMPISTPLVVIPQGNIIPKPMVSPSVKKLILPFSVSTPSVQVSTVKELLQSTSQLPPKPVLPPAPSLPKAPSPKPVLPPAPKVVLPVAPKVVLPPTPNQQPVLPPGPRVIAPRVIAPRPALPTMPKPQ